MVAENGMLFVTRNSLSCQHMARLPLPACLVEQCGQEGSRPWAGGVWADVMSPISRLGPLNHLRGPPPSLHTWCGCPWVPGGKDLHWAPKWLRGAASSHSYSHTGIDWTLRECNINVDYLKPLKWTDCDNRISLQGAPKLCLWPFFISLWNSVCDPASTP